MRFRWRYAALVAWVWCGSAAAAIDPIADWNVRKAGAVFAENFNYASAAQAAQSPGFRGSNTPPHDPNFNNVFQIVDEPGHRLSGKALRVRWINGGAQGNWILMMNGNSSDLAGAHFRKVYVQIVMWVGPLFDYSFKESGGGQATPKMVILDYHNASSTVGEFVITNEGCRGFITGYRKTSAYPGAPSGESAALLERRLATPVNNFNFQMQNAIDRGGPLSTQNDYERRYGPFVYGLTGGLSNNPPSLAAQGTPDPDAAIGGMPWYPNNLVVIEAEMDLYSDRLRYWAAKYGEAPILVGDTDLDNTVPLSGVTPTSRGWLGNRANPANPAWIGWSGIQLTNFVTNAASNQVNFPEQNYTDYVEVIVSESPIPFPGNLPVPGVGLAGPVTPGAPTGLVAD